VTGVTIYARLSLSVTLYAPSHSLIDLAADAAHLCDLSVTDCAIDLGSYVRLVGEKDVGLSLEPVDANPGGLFSSGSYGGELFDFGAIGLDRVVTYHAGACIRRSSVRPACGVLVADNAIELRAVFFRDVLVVVEIYGLARRFRPAQDAQQGESDD
jgi:hypothetical protein